MTVSHQQLSEILEKIKRHSPDSFILMSPNSIGEVLVTCAFARSFIEQHKKPVSICVRPEHADLVKVLYPNRFKVVVDMPMGLMSAFRTSGFVEDGVPTIEKPIVLSPPLYHGGVLHALHNLCYTRNGVSGITLPDMWRQMLGLSWDAPMEKPSSKFFELNKNVLEKFGVEAGKFVLFQLGNNTNKPLPNQFWEALEDEYRQMGLPILVNSHGAMLVSTPPAFSNVSQVTPNVLEALLLIHYSAATVSGNNGLMLCDIFADFQIENKHWHVISSDKYCKHYELLKSDWHNAFVPFDGKPAIHVGGAEVINNPSALYEWFIGADLEPDTYQAIAADMAAKNIDSEFYYPPREGILECFPAPNSFSQ